MRPQLPLFRRSLSELAAPSKSYHTLSGISINAAALIARSSPYYRRALRPRSYAALAEFIATPLPLLPFAAPSKVLEEEARTSGKPKSTIPITRAIYRSCEALVRSFDWSAVSSFSLNISIRLNSHFFMHRVDGPDIFRENFVRERRLTCACRDRHNCFYWSNSSGIMKRSRQKLR